MKPTERVVSVEQYIETTVCLNFEGGERLILTLKECEAIQRVLANGVTEDRSKW